MQAYNRPRRRRTIAGSNRRYGALVSGLPVPRRQSSPGVRDRHGPPRLATAFTRSLAPHPLNGMGLQMTGEVA